MRRLGCGKHHPAANTIRIILRIILLLQRHARGMLARDCWVDEGEQAKDDAMDGDGAMED